jgi:hypothetical protein
MAGNTVPDKESVINPATLTNAHLRRLDFEKFNALSSMIGTWVFMVGCNVLLFLKSN